MKIKSGFMLREISGSYIVVPLGERVVEFNGMISLSSSGALLWKKLSQGAEQPELVDTLLEEYDIDKETASSDVDEFVSGISLRGLLE